MHEALVPGGNNRDESWTSERCYIRELLNDPRVPATSLAVARVECGVTTELHRLSVAEWYVIADGMGLMRVGNDTPFEVNPGDTVAIPPGVTQQITNSGDTDLVFYCLCQPRFTAACYESLENEP